MKINNPFFNQENFNGIYHLKKNSFETLFTIKYWSRMFKWNFIKGISIPIFFLFCYQIKLILKNSYLNTINKIILTTIASQFLYQIIVRGQIEHPWYSFYYLPFYYLFITYNSNFISKKLLYIILIIGIFISIPYKNINMPSMKNIIIPINSIGWTLPCLQTG